MNKKSQTHIAWNRIKKYVFLNIPHLNAKKNYRFLQLYCSLIKTTTPLFKQKDSFVFYEYNKQDSPIFKDKKLPIISAGKKLRKSSKKRKKDNRKKYLNYFKTTKWINFKKELIKIRGSICEKCKNECSVLHGHHITYERLYNELPKDIILLCPQCHKNVHNK